MGTDILISSFSFRTSVGLLQWPAGEEAYLTDLTSRASVLFSALVNPHR